MVEFPARTTFDSWRVTNQIWATKRQQKWVDAQNPWENTPGFWPNPTAIGQSRPYRPRLAVLFRILRTPFEARLLAATHPGADVVEILPLSWVITRQHGWTWPVVFDDPGWFTYCKWWANYDITRWYTPHYYGNVNLEGPLKPWDFPFQRNSRGFMGCANQDPYLGGAKQDISTSEVEV